MIGSQMPRTVPCRPAPLTSTSTANGSPFEGLELLDQLLQPLTVVGLLLVDDGRCDEDGALALETVARYRLNNPDSDTVTLPLTIRTGADIEQWTEPTTAVELQVDGQNLPTQVSEDGNLTAQIQFATDSQRDVTLRYTVPLGQEPARSGPMTNSRWTVF